MKKVLFSLLLTSASMMMFGQSQVLVTENFNAFTDGNLATDATGATAGQNGWYIYLGAGANYQVATIDVNHGKSVNITTGNGAPPATGSNTNARYAFKGWSTSASTSNNLVRATMEIYTGAATGKGRVGIQLLSTAATIGGIVYDYETKRIYGQARVSVVAAPTQTGLLSLELGTQVFPANSWVTVTYIYNKTTGQHSYQYTNGTIGAAYNFSTNTTYATYTGDIAAEFDAVNTTLATNTIANTAGFDNVLTEFTNAALLSIDDVKSANTGELSLVVYPNPTSDILNIKSASKINSVSVVDLSGRKVNVKLEGDKVDVRSLSAGTYLINVETKDGAFTEKFIKK